MPADCPGCQIGEHGGHNDGWNRDPGALTGPSCGCTGDCAQRHRRTAHTPRVHAQRTPALRTQQESAPR